MDRDAEHLHLERVTIDRAEFADLGVDHSVGPREQSTQAGPEQDQTPG
jgi:hypothetical protein